MSALGKMARPWPVVLDILRSLDVQFMEKALSGVELDWRPLTEIGKRDALLRKQAEMRKRLVKLLTSQPEYKDLLNPTKAIKMATEAATAAKPRSWMPSSAKEPV